MNKQPPTIQSARVPGPDYDPIDWIVQDLQNLSSFLAHLSMNTRDTDYLDAHFMKILELRRSIARQLENLIDEPYNYPHTRLQLLHRENQTIFAYVQEVVNALRLWDDVKFKQLVKVVEKAMSKFDGDLTP